MSRRTVPTAPHLSRRRVVQVGGAVLAAGPLAALVGCGRRDPAGSSPADGSDGDDPDTALLGAVLAEVDATAVLVAALRRRERDLRQPFAALAATHDSHRARLASAAPQRPGDTDSAAVDLPRRRAAALAVVRRQEQALQERLASAAVEAQSGTFARMLASMAAGIAQHRATAPLADA